MTIETAVPAKINLWLEVTGKRPDGYHDISSLMLPVTVFDRIGIEVEAGEGPVSLECSEPEIPHDAQNLAWRAADLFREATGNRSGVRMRLDKAIPSGAGLGGGSSDAAGVLVSLNEHFGKPLSGGELERLALRLGADVPFFLYRRPALATGVGEKLEFAGEVPGYPLVLIKPPLSVPTAWVYQSLKLTRGGSQITLRNFSADPWRLAEFVQNDLEPVTASRHPVVSDLKRWLLERGAPAAAMSGSGPTVFGIFESGGAARAVAAEARAAWEGFWVCAAEVIGAPDAGMESRP